MTDSRADDATIAASLSSYPPVKPLSDAPRPVPPTPHPEQQKLILRPADDGYVAASPVDPTSRVRASAYNPPVVPNVNTSYPGYAPPNMAGYAPVSEPFVAPPGRDRGRGRIVALLLILFVLLILLATLTLFTLRYTGILGNKTLASTPTLTTSLTPSQQARAVVQQYYDDINKKDYQTAYNLWWQNSLTYDQFVNGYANTLRDDITFDQITPLTDGTVQVDITIHATEQGASGTVNSVYKGTYLVGQQNGIWKFLSGTFQKIG